MKKRTTQMLHSGSILVILFAVWTILVQTVDVKPMGETGALVGLASMNGWFHRIVGVHMWLYAFTDWLGLVPVGVCLLFAILGLRQVIKRKGLRNADPDLIVLGVYYALVIVCYVAFERFPINYRPIFIEGRLEASYPSSTTLLVLTVMPTLVFQTKRRWEKGGKLVTILTMIFSVFTVLGRLIAGVHWLTDIVGSVLLSAGLFQLYRTAVLVICE